MKRGERAVEIGLQIAGAAVLAAVGLVLLPVRWHQAGHAIAGRWGLATAAVIGAGCAGAGLWLAGRRRRRLRRWPLRALPWWFAALALAGVIAAGVIAVSLLLDEADKAKTPDQQAQLRIDAIKTGLSVAAGTGGAAALLLATRRQWATERSQAHEEFDAGERRVTELYTKAVEQLGSDKAPVRLGGLYALERLAQGNPDHRQTIIDVICAYLRMPYTPPPATTTGPPPRPATMRQLRQTRNQPPPTAAAPSDPREEHQVRLTAQRILQRHLTLTTDLTPDAAARLKPDPDHDFWPDIHIDLTDATLTDFNLNRAHLAAARFTRTTFTGSAWFVRATFTDIALFDGATFTDIAWFIGATFTGDAGFDGVAFTGDARFTEARFTGDASFDAVTFTDEAGFAGATFTGEVISNKDGIPGKIAAAQP